eukprot:5418738-Lingulodinium_polyedra.AAC.1
MARFTQKQFHQVMAVIIGHLQGVQAARQAPRRVLEAKFVNSIEKFAGGEEKWKEWSFDFNIA